MNAVRKEEYGIAIIQQYHHVQRYKEDWRGPGAKKFHLKLFSGGRIIKGALVVTLDTTHRAGQRTLSDRTVEIEKCLFFSYFIVIRKRSTIFIL